MINNNKGKFTRNIQDVEMELGAKNGLMQVIEDKNRHAVKDLNGDGKITKEDILLDKPHNSDKQLTPEQPVAPKLPKNIPQEALSNWEAFFKNQGGVMTPQLQQLHNALATYEKQVQAYNTDVQVYNTYYTNEKDKQVALIRKSQALDVAEITHKKDIEVAGINKEAQKYAADKALQGIMIQNDPKALDANETKAYELIKKIGLLEPETLKTFMEKVASGDKQAKNDALELEKALGKDGKKLKVDGVIDQHTIDAARGLIGENADAIIKYEQVMQGVKNPASAGAKPIVENGGKQFL